MNGSTDPSLLQDFLTEANELVEQLDSDLVKLENAGSDAQAQDLLNAIFRALHTIKGAASFLALTHVTAFAHVAEDALNRMRKGEVHVTAEVMDALLRSVDVVRTMLGQIADGQDAAPGPADLIERLQAISQSAHGGGKAEHAMPETPAEDEAQANGGDRQAAAQAADAPTGPNGEQSLALQLPAQKQDLIEFMVADLHEYSAQIDECLNQVSNHATRGEAVAHLGQMLDGMEKTADFFELADLTALVRLLVTVTPAIATLDDALIDEVLVRMRAARKLIDDQGEALKHNRELRWPLETFTQRLRTLATNQALPDDVAGRHGSDIAAVLALDGVCGHVPATAPANTADAAEAEGPALTPDADANTAAASSSPTPAAAAKGTQVEQTIRVEVSRLEALLNLVGQLVLSKNRIGSLARRSRELDELQDFAEEMTIASGELDRLTSELQVGVMRTRMQPLAKLFDRYPRVIRDVARMTGKKIDLQIVGRETEVDKSVLELLADPLVHILRNSADHGVEPPDVRLKKGKPQTGTIRLSAEHQGSHVRVAIEDDGKGLHRDVLGRKAVDRGLCTDEQLSQMADEEVFRFIFAPGFSTAEQVSDLSGRGVGMDVVRSNVNKLNGAINISSAADRGTTIEILIPLTVAIMPAMVVGVGAHLYAVPLQSIEEIVRPEAQVVHSIAGRPVMRLRDAVLPLIDMRQRLHETSCEDGGRFAVVVAVAGQRAGLMVDRLVGQQEIVIKPLDDAYTRGGPFSGATIRENGDVSLILDVIQLIRSAQLTGTGPGSSPLREAA